MLLRLSLSSSLDLSFNSKYSNNKSFNSKGLDILVCKQLALEHKVKIS